MKIGIYVFVSLLFLLESPLSFSDLVKRSASDELRYFNCQTISNPVCSEETCTWVCRNPSSGEHCRASTLKKGVDTNNRGQHLFCNYEGGCEGVVCPDSCVNNPLACSCGAIYHINDLVVVQPSGCLSLINHNMHNSSEVTPTVDNNFYTTVSSISLTEYNDHSNINSNSNALAIGLSIGVPVTIATFVITTALFFIYYSRHKSNVGNSTPYGHITDGDL